MNYNDAVKGIEGPSRKEQCQGCENGRQGR